MILHSAILCLALNIFYEARGESYFGQLAVAHVTLNRVKENNTTICKEVFKPKQFSWTEKKFKIPTEKDQNWIQAKEIANKALKTNDTTHGSTFFFEKKCKRVRSVVNGRKMVMKLGNHIFYANK